MKSPSSPTAQPQATTLPAHRADAALWLIKEIRAYTCWWLVTWWEDLCSPAWGCNTAQGQEWAFWSTLGWIAFPAGLFCLLPGWRMLATSMTILCGHSKSVFPLCSTVCSPGLGKRAVDKPTPEPNIGSHLPHESLFSWSKSSIMNGEERWPTEIILERVIPFLESWPLFRCSLQNNHGPHHTFTFLCH